MSGARLATHVYTTAEVKRTAVRGDTRRRAHATRRSLSQTPLNAFWEPGSIRAGDAAFARRHSGEMGYISFRRHG
jgi:hypothetical protein